MFLVMQTGKVQSCLIVYQEPALQGAQGDIQQHERPDKLRSHDNGKQM